MELITFCINTARNELDHLKLLFKSLELNLFTSEHEIIVFIDSDNEGSFEWLLSQKNKFKNLKLFKNHLNIPYGYARNINEMFLNAEHDIVSYLQSDMVICKNYDVEILKSLERDMILCSTSITPPLHPKSDTYISMDLGLYPDEFDLINFTNTAETLKSNKITEYFFAPFTLYKDVWNTIGGHDTRFRRSREDSDILLRLVLNNTKIIQVWNAIVYHFSCTSSRGKDWFNPNNIQAIERKKKQEVADSIEMFKFFNKWGFFSHSLEKVKVFIFSAKVVGDLNENNKYLFNNLKYFFKKIEVNNYFITDHLIDHSIANDLLNIESDVWGVYKYMYNDITPIEYSKISNLEDVIVEINLNNLTQYDFNILQNLNQILNNEDTVGKFAIPNSSLSLTINQLTDNSSELIKVNNPTIKEEDKYLIY